MVTTTKTFTTTVADDGTVRVPADLAKPGETVTVRVDRPTVADEPEDQTDTDGPVRLTRLTAKTPEQKEELLRQINEIAARLAPKLKNMPDHGDFLYGDDGMPR